LLIVSPFVIRVCCLSRVPDLEVPFNVDDFCRVDITEGENAADDFREAAKILEATKFNNEDYGCDNDQFWRAYDSTIEDGWDVAPNYVKAWLEAHRPALEIWYRGTKRERCVFVPIQNLDLLSDSQTHQAMRNFTRIATLESVRLESQGQLDEAAEMNLAILRTDRLMVFRGDRVDVMCGMSLADMASANLLRWSSSPSLTSDQIRVVLEHVKAQHRSFEPESMGFKIEYLILVNHLKKHGYEPDIDLNSLPEALHPYAMNTIQAYYWVIGEPEFSRRITLQLLANELDEVDKPIAERSSLASKQLLLFAARGPISKNRLAPANLEAALGRSYMRDHFQLSNQLYDLIFHRGRACQLELEMFLAAQIYFREHNQFPEEASILVPDLLDAVPVDPTDPYGSLIKYERIDANHARISDSIGQVFDINAR
jgi:hypothetical protein